MTSPTPHHKITPAHLSRKAVVYLRQSSERQVQEHTESQRLQYALADRARELGWQRVELIDTDLGRSAALGAARREGFERLVASVALGEVGIVFSREASRLSRTDRDWCHLFEVCQIFGTLIGDAEQIYDLALMDDQLVLGIKATLSVVELKVLKLRLLQGMEEKARRGELKRLLPVGYIRDALDQVVKDPDQRVQEALALVFQKFRELRSARQTFLWFRTHGVELPVNKCGGNGVRVAWQLPTNAFLQNLLRNPAYAGAYVWGRREVRMAFEDGRLRKRQGRLRRAEQCRVFLRDHHEEYIPWETFEGNVQILRANDMKGASDESVGAVRAGQGLLSGLLRCGRCGRKLHVRYWGKRGTAARYLCQGAFQGGGEYCQGFGGRLVDERVGHELLAALSPLGMRASLAAAERLSARDQDQRQVVARQLEQAEYEATRAAEQYHAVDPRNRLVAAELERRWNAKLEACERLRAARAELDSAIQVLGEPERAHLLGLGQPALPRGAEEADSPGRGRRGHRDEGGHGPPAVRDPLAGRVPHRVHDGPAALGTRAADRARGCGGHPPARRALRGRCHRAGAQQARPANREGQAVERATGPHGPEHLCHPRALPHRARPRDPHADAGGSALRGQPGNHHAAGDHRHPPQAPDPALGAVGDPTGRSGLAPGPAGPRSTSGDRKVRSPRGPLNKPANALRMKSRRWEWQVL